MEVISIERSTYEELLTSFNSFVTKMKEMTNRGKDKGLGDWLDNQDVCQMLNISPRTLQTLRDNGTLAYSQINRKLFYKPEDVESILHVVADRDKLTLVHIEQNVKSTSHVFYSFFNFGCKTSTSISFGIHRYAKCSSLRNKKLEVNGG